MGASPVPSQTKVDHINPAHYQSGGMEVIEVLRDQLSPEEFKGFLKGNIFKYLARSGKKPNNPGSQDCKKAEWYLNQLIGTFENEEQAKG